MGRVKYELRVSVGGGGGSEKRSGGRHWKASVFESR